QGFWLMATAQGGRFILGWQLPRGKGDGPQLSKRIQALMDDPQAMGNYMTYRDAIRILGLDPGNIYAQGRIDLDLSRWSDLGWRAAPLGPPPAAVERMRPATVPENIGPSSPDLIAPLRELAAVKKFGRPRGPEFEVIGTEGAQAGVAFTIQTVIDPGDEVICTTPVTSTSSPRCTSPAACRCASRWGRTTAIASSRRSCAATSPSAPS